VVSKCLSKFLMECSMNVFKKVDKIENVTKT